MENTITKFEIGKVYATRSACNHDCIFDFEILGRTEKMVKIMVHGEVKRRKIHMFNDGVESFLPHGNYSMSAVISADIELDAV